MVVKNLVSSLLKATLISDNFRHGKVDRLLVEELHGGENLPEILASYGAVYSSKRASFRLIIFVAPFIIFRARQVLRKVSL